MNKKSFLRGFGLGVLFTAIILGVSFSIRTSESATVSRAKKLGMVFESNGEKVAIATPEVPEVSAVPSESTQPEESVQPDKSTEPEASVQPKMSTVPASSTTPVESSSADKNKGNKTTKDNKNNNSEEFEKEKQKAEKEMEDIKKQLIINDGDWAGKVSDELERLGIIDDANAFDRYLVKNGYSNVINSGTYDVSPEDSYHDLAEKITSRFK